MGLGRGTHALIIPTCRVRITVSPRVGLDKAGVRVFTEEGVEKEKMCPHIAQQGWVGGS